MNSDSKAAGKQAALKQFPKTVLKNMASRLGLEIRRKPTVQPQSRSQPPDGFDGAYQLVQDHTMVAREGLSCLYNQVVFCERNALPGDYVECGVWKGGSVGIMALANLKHGKSRRQIHLFDAFDDICEPDAAVDGERAVREVREWSKSAQTQGRLVPVRGIYDRFGGHGTLEGNRRLLEKVVGYPAERLHFYQGWFQETLPLHSPKITNIAVLRVDADWYASTSVCLDHLYNKVVPGGFVIIDDYGAYDGCRKAVDEFISKLGKPVYLNEVNSEIRYLIKA
jgi:O-methyltransferase